MQRITIEQTKKLEDSQSLDSAIERLALFENLYEDVINSQKTISEQLESLRKADKQKTVQFRELMIKKLNNTNFLVAFDLYGIK